MIADIYACSLVVVFFTQSGAIFTVIDDVKKMSEEDFTNKKRIALLTIIFTPTILILALVQNEYMIHPYNVAGRVVVAVVMLTVAVCWWIFSSITYYMTLIQIRTPPKFIDITFFICLLAVIFFSLFNIMLTFAWVTLGLLLDPGRVAAFFVGFLTVIAVVLFKIQSLSQLMREAETALHVKLYQAYSGKKKDEITEEDFNTIETMKMDGPKIVDYMIEKGLDQKLAEGAAQRILAFRRFRVRFLIGNLFGTLFVLLALIVFILLGVEAFRSSAGLVTSIGSVLEGAAGGSSVISDKLGDKQADIQNLVHEFTSKQIGGNVPNLRLGHNSAIELNHIEPTTTNN